MADGVDTKNACIKATADILAAFAEHSLITPDNAGKIFAQVFNEIWESVSAV